MTDFENFSQLLYRHPLDSGQIWRTRADPRSALTREISSDWVYSVVHEKQKIRILQIFQICQCAVVPPNVVETKLNVGAQIQTFLGAHTPRLHRWG